MLRYATFVLRFVRALLISVKVRTARSLTTLKITPLEFALGSQAAKASAIGDKLRVWRKMPEARRTATTDNKEPRTITCR